jgi:hypothetical protein
MVAGEGGSVVSDALVLNQPRLAATVVSLSTWGRLAEGNLERSLASISESS